MIKKGLKLAGFIGAVVMMLASFGTEVYAETSDLKLLSDINRILRLQDWDDRAVATNVKEYASIRKDKSTESTRVGILIKGAYVEVVEYGEEWTLVKSGDIKGYMLTKYLAFGEEAKEIYNEVHGVTGTVTVKSADIMDHPFSKSNIVTKKAKGAEVEILAQVGNWYRIQLNKTTTAYIYVNNVKVKESVAMTVEAYKEMTEPKETTKTETSSNQTGSGVTASKSELDMLAAIIQCEAEGESYKGKVAVGAVVLNRVKSSEFPNTIEKVIKQKGQFSPVASGRFAKVLKQGANAECYRAAKDALNGVNPIGKCLFFNTGYGKGFRIGGHQFY